MPIPAFSLRIFLSLVLLLVLFAVMPAAAFDGQSQPAEVGGPRPDADDGLPPHKANQILIKVTKGAQQQILPGAAPVNTGVRALDALNARLGAREFGRIVERRPTDGGDEDVFRWYVVTFRGASKKGIEELISAYKANPSVEAAEPNLILAAIHDPALPNIPNDFLLHDELFTPDQRLFTDHDNLWGMKKIGSEDAWTLSTGSSEVVVGVVDTGVDYTYPDLAEQIWNNPGETGTDDLGRDKRTNGVDDDGNGMIDDWRGFDFINSRDLNGDGDYLDPSDINDADPMDDNGHGTAVSGVIGAQGDNDPTQDLTTGKSLVGVNWTVSIMPIKFLSSSGYGSVEDAISAIVYGADQGAHVLNNSWGGPAGSEGLADAIEYAVQDRGVVFVAAAGNDEEDALLHDPAASPHAIAAGSSNYLDERSCFSNFGTKIDVVAPGGESSRCSPLTDCVLSARWPSENDGRAPVIGSEYYLCASGTSLSAPHVSGVAALILSLHPDFTPEEIRQVLRSSADDVLGAGWDQDSGYGRLNAFRALSEWTDPPPVAKISAPAPQSGSPTPLDIVGTATARMGLSGYDIWIGQGLNPDSFTHVAGGSSPVEDGLLATVDSPFTGWVTVRLDVTDVVGGTGTDRTVAFVDDVLPGWPILLDRDDNLHIISHALADFDRDGDLDIATTLDGQRVRTPQIQVRDAFGNDLPGWPRDITESEFVGMSPPTLADLNGDESPDILAAATIHTDIVHINTTTIYAIDGDGQNLPGWPKQIEDTLTYPSKPTVGDLNGDGAQDVVYVDCSGQVYVWSADGTELAQWPITDGFLCGIQVRYSVEEGRGPHLTVMPSLADIDGDGADEILVAGARESEFGAARAHAWNWDGSAVPGWPVVLDIRHVESSLAVADLDFDGVLEVVAKGVSPSGFIVLTVEVLREDGTRLSPWPKTIPFDSTSAPCYTADSASSPIIADISGDAKPEIIVPASDRYFAWEVDGTDVSGWPVELMPPQGIGLEVCQDRPYEPAAIYLDNDPKAELIVTAIEGPTHPAGYYALDGTGAMMWEKTLGRPLASPIIGDLDEDGRLELAGALRVPFDSTQDFPMLLVWPLDFSRMLDADGDGVCDPDAPSSDPSVCTGSDNCPSVSNPLQEDIDGDGIGDVCDDDNDNDGLTDSEETALGTDPLNPDSDYDYVSDGPDDPDGAGSVVAGPDNCPNTQNMNQYDNDGDGAGDVCDDDDDNDGFGDVSEEYMGTDPLADCSDGATVGHDAWPPDFNMDRVVNILDLVQLLPPFFGSSPPDPNYSQRKDFNGDEVIDMVDIDGFLPYFGGTCQVDDFDGDGIGDGHDDSDNDGFTDRIEIYIGTDPLDACPDIIGEHDAWPPDFTMDRFVNITDWWRIYLQRGRWVSEDPEELQRLDLNEDWYIDQTDINVGFIPYFGQTCTN